jgi:transketolase
LEQKFSAFGCQVQHVDGHDIEALTEVLSNVPFEKEKPVLILAHTIKGKGISFIENNHKWHHHVPTDEELKAAIRELEQALKDIDEN